MSESFAENQWRDIFVRDFLSEVVGFGEVLRCAGRVVGVLDDGFVLQDETGRLDVVFGGDVFVGDIVSVLVFKEKRVVDGKVVEVFVGNEVKVVKKCEGDFFVSLSSPNYKRVVVDLYLKEKFVLRSKIIGFIREFFVEKGFLEVDTPALVRFSGMEPYLDVFKTRFSYGNVHANEVSNGDFDMFLITSPEYAMKKLLVGGFEKIFQISKSFRNKEVNSDTHNPEFSLLEWYRAFADYEDMMRDTEELVEFLAIKLFGKAEFVYKGRKIDVSVPWDRISVVEAFERFAGVSREVFESENGLLDLAISRGLIKDGNNDDGFFAIFMNEIEGKLGVDRPVILFDYPASMAALAKKKGKYAERFEVYIAGIELCNAFSELNDANEQRLRLEGERRLRRELGKLDYSVDYGFIEALEFGMPPAGGNALGIDRLVMLLTDSEKIDDVVLFPFRDL